MTTNLVELANAEDSYPYSQTPYRTVPGNEYVLKSSAHGIVEHGGRSKESLGGGSNVKLAKDQAKSGQSEREDDKKDDDTIEKEPNKGGKRRQPEGSGRNPPGNQRPSLGPGILAPGGICAWDNGDHVYEAELLNDGMIMLLGAGTHAANTIGLTRFQPGDRVRVWEDDGASRHERVGVIEYSRMINFIAMHQVRFSDGTRSYYTVGDLERAP